jgi:hypothetical protein
MPPDEMLCPVALVGTDVSEENIASIIRVTRIGQLETTLAVTSKRSTLRRNTIKRMDKLVSNTRLVMQRGVGLAGNGVGFLNGQTTKRDNIASVEGVGSSVVYKARLKDTEPRLQVYLGHVPKVFGSL